MKVKTILTESNQEAKNFVREFYRMGYPNPLVRNAVAFGYRLSDGDEGVVNVELDTIGDSVILKSITATPQGKGLGQLVMKKLTDLADRENVSIVLDVEPFNRKSTVDQLHSFYRKFDFVKDDDMPYGFNLIRHPK